MTKYTLQQLQEISTKLRSNRHAWSDENGLETFFYEVMKEISIRKRNKKRLKAFCAAI